MEQAFLLFERMQFIETVEQGDGAEAALQFFELRDLLFDLFSRLLVLDQFAFAFEQGFGDLDRPLFLRDQFLGAGDPTPCSSVSETRRALIAAAALSTESCSFPEKSRFEMVSRIFSSPTWVSSIWLM